MRVIFMGTPDFAVPTLQALIDSEHEVVAVYTAPPRPANRGKKISRSVVHERAEQHGLHVETPKSLKKEEAQQQFRDYQADIAVVVAYGLLLPPEILEACPYGCINVHPSALPRWRGAAPVQRTIMAGDRETAICIMQMDRGLDTGNILLQKTYAVPESATAQDLSVFLSGEAAPMVLQVMDGLSQDSIVAVPQPTEGVTYADKIRKEECRIDFSQPADIVRYHIHGLSPFPGAYIMLEAERIKLLGVEVVEGSGKEAGTILDERLTIQCGEGAIRPLMIQRQGKKPMEAEACLRGLDCSVGSII